MSLLHPDGAIREPGDLVVVDEKTTELARLLNGALRPDGIAYLAGGRRARTRARRAGLEIGPVLLELGELLVPVERNALRWALRTRAPSQRAALIRLLPARVVGLAARRAVARRPHARPLAEWLHALGRGTSVVLSGETAFLIDAAGVTLAARVEPSLPGSRTEAERRALLELGTDARAAGAAVPAPLDQTELAGASLLLVTGLPGTPASQLIARRPPSRAALVDRLASWLGRWNEATAVERVLSPELLERTLLAPAFALELDTPHFAALEGLAAAAAGRRVKLVAAHNDLTTANVLVEPGAPLGIVDWESAEREGLPLGDLLYAVADAEAAVSGFRRRPDAFLASLEEQAAHERPLVDRLALDPVVADVCFHACWLAHAANERQAAGRQTRLPFLEIVRTIGGRQLRLDAAA
jgi:hypothetical protein